MLKIKKSHISWIALAVILIFPAIFFGLLGVKTIVGFFILLFLPTYLILKRFELEWIETVLFSGFLALIITPLLVWYTSRVVPSLRLSIIATAVLLIAIAIYLKFIKKPTSTNVKQGEQNIER